LHDLRLQYGAFFDCDERMRRRFVKSDCNTVFGSFHPEHRPAALSARLEQRGNLSVEAASAKSSNDQFPLPDAVRFRRHMLD